MTYDGVWYGTPLDLLPLRPSSSGLPEVMGYLNGVLLPRIFNIKTLLVKVFSVIMAVSSGMPVGPEQAVAYLQSWRSKVHIKYT